MAVIGAKGNLPGSRGSFEDDAEEKEFVCTQVMEFCHVSTEKYGFKALMFRKFTFKFYINRDQWKLSIILFRCFRK